VLSSGGDDGDEVTAKIGATRLSAFDWDSNPDLVDPSIGVWVEAHHVPTGAVVLVFVLHGGWPSYALYDFCDALSALLPERTNIYIPAFGAMRVSVYLCSSDPRGWMPNPVALGLADLSARFTYAAIARAFASLRTLPISPVDPHIGLPKLTGNERCAFAAALSTLADAEYPKTTDATRVDGTEVWLKPRQSLHHPTDFTYRIQPGEIASNAELVAYIKDHESRNY
jgi:hypothetical protein